MEHRRSHRTYYEDRLIEEMERIINDCDKRVQRQQKRLDENNQNGKLADELAGEIQELCRKAEEEGARGHLDESMELLRKVEELKQKQNALKVSICFSCALLSITYGNLQWFLFMIFIIYYLKFFFFFLKNYLKVHNFS
eukprot:TRINITY_DN164_c0_g1_i4.p1 TRINITY_DN164_c0_g1~~TRINITY_DN164_c0_g1_i4.p1  ORF type:complete len:139 (+),score=21.88 TRINITY_DN164_c0_g1_i4:317-733(+)